MKTEKNDAKPITMDDLSAQLTELSASATTIQNVADGEGRTLAPEERAELKKIQAAFKEVEEEISLREASAQMESTLRQPQARITKPADGIDADDAPAPRAALTFQGGLKSGTSKGTHGFTSVGAWAIAARATKNGHPDARIVNAPASYGSEGQNTDGGFAVPPDFRADVSKQVLAEDSLLGRTDQQVTSGNSLSLPIDATTPWGTNGPQAAWTGEGGTIGGSKPDLSLIEIKAHKLAALVPVTSELVEDAPSLSRWLMSKVPDMFTSAINDALINGNGVQKPMGMLNAASKVTVAAKSGQGANTIVAENVMAMWSRCYGQLRKDAIWMINQDCEPQLQSMVVPGSSPAFPVYLPPGGLSGAPYATLFGRPIVTSESCKALGTEGDIILCVPSQYVSVTKTSGMRSDMSMHLYFDSDLLAFRFVMRLGGQSMWAAPIARRNGANTLSPIVTLNSTRT